MVDLVFADRKPAPPAAASIYGTLFLNISTPFSFGGELDVRCIDWSKG
jgi:hypothetical protein